MPEMEPAPNMQPQKPEYSYNLGRFSPYPAGQESNMSGNNGPEYSDQYALPPAALNIGEGHTGSDTAPASPRIEPTIFQDPLQKIRRQTNTGADNRWSFDLPSGGFPPKEETRPAPGLIDEDTPLEQLPPDPVVKPTPWSDNFVAGLNIIDRKKNPLPNTERDKIEERMTSLDLSRPPTCERHPELREIPLDKRESIVSMEIQRLMTQDDSSPQEATREALALIEEYSDVVGDQFLQELREGVDRYGTRRNTAQELPFDNQDILNEEERNVVRRINNWPENYAPAITRLASGQFTGPVCIRLAIELGYPPDAIRQLACEGRLDRFLEQHLQQYAEVPPEINSQVANCDQKFNSLSGHYTGADKQNSSIQLSLVNERAGVCANHRFGISEVPQRPISPPIVVVGNDLAALLTARTAVTGFGNTNVTILGKGEWLGGDYVEGNRYTSSQPPPMTVDIRTKQGKLYREELRPRTDKDVERFYEDMILDPSGKYYSHDLPEVTAAKDVRIIPVGPLDYHITYTDANGSTRAIKSPMVVLAPGSGMPLLPNSLIPFHNKTESRISVHTDLADLKLRARQSAEDGKRLAIWGADNAAQKAIRQLLDSGIDPQRISWHIPYYMGEASSFLSGRALESLRAFDNTFSGYPGDWDSLVAQICDFASRNGAVHGSASMPHVMEDGTMQFKRRNLSTGGILSDYQAPPGMANIVGDKVTLWMFGERGFTEEVIKGYGMMPIGPPLVTRNTSGRVDYAQGVVRRKEALLERVHPGFFALGPVASNDTYITTDETLGTLIYQVNSMLLPLALADQMIQSYKPGRYSTPADYSR